MKKRINIAVLCAVVLTLGSCSEFLTQVPRSDLAASEFWQTERDVKNWMNGVYNGVLEGLTGNLRYWGEGRSDNYFPTAYQQGATFQKNALTPSLTTVDWSGLYTVIGRCNTAFKNIPGMDITAQKKAQFQAECHGIRALMYFYIVRLWGDCPLLLEAWDLSYETRYNSRASVAQVSAAIENDINASISYFEANGERESSCYIFNLAAAYALKMDFLAWKGRFGEIIDVYGDFTANVTNKELSTVANWKTTFTNPSSGKEAIFSIAWDENYNARMYSNFASALGFIDGTQHGFALGRDVFRLMVQDVNDIRLWGVLQFANYTGDLVASNAPVYGPRGSNNSVQRLYKFVENGAARGTFNDTKRYYFEPSIYRYTEVLLLYAEALNRTDKGGDAIEIINTIRANRGSSIRFSIDDYPIQLGNSAASREKLIMDERQLELFCEGKRWFDLLRLDWGYDVINAHLEYLQYQDGDDLVGFGKKTRLLFPIYMSNIANNSLIKQNPDY